MQDKRFIQLFFLFNFFQNFIFVYAVDKIFFQSRGISLSQLGILLALWSASVILFEIPTGMLADRWNRKYMLIIGSILYFCCYAIWLFSFSFLGFLIGYLFRSLASSFINGTMQSYLYDVLIDEERKDEFAKVWGKSRMLNLAGTAIALVCGGFIAQYSLSLTIILSLLPCICLTVIALLFPDVQREKPVKIENHFSFFIAGLKETLQSPILLQSFLFSGIVLAAWGLLDEYWSLYFRWVGYPLASIGILYAAIYCISASAGSVAHRFKKYSLDTLMWGVVGIAAVVIVSGVLRTYLIILPILAIAFLIEVVNILIEDAIQHHAPQGKRATIASMNAILQRFDIVLSVIFGFIAQRVGIQGGFLFIGVFLFLYPITVILQKDHAAIV